MSDIMVKICGIHDYFEAQLAAEEGANFLGFFVLEGNSSLSLEKRELIWKIKCNFPNICTVAVTKKGDYDDLKYLDDSGLFSHLQIQTLPNLSSLEIIRRNTACSIITVIAEGAWLGFEACDLKPYTDWLLIDSAYRGGTGRTVSIEELLRIKEWWEDSATLIVAGGLDYSNVHNVIDAVRPNAVDVYSGVRDCSRQIDSDKLRRFIAAVRQYY